MFVILQRQEVKKQIVSAYYDAGPGGGPHVSGRLPSRRDAKKWLITIFTITSDNICHIKWPGVPSPGRPGLNHLDHVHVITDAARIRTLLIQLAYLRHTGDILNFGASGTGKLTAKLLEGPLAAKLSHSYPRQ